MEKLIAMNENDRRVGEDHHNAKLTDCEVELVRKLREEGMTYAAIAEKFDISKTAAFDICTYRRRAETAVRFKRVRVSDPADDKVPA